VRRIVRRFTVAFASGIIDDAAVGRTSPYRFVNVPDRFVKITASPRGALCRAAGLVLAAIVAGCATPPSDPAERAVFEQNHDPLEPLNRQTLDLNLFVDRILLKPAT
jgi:hypothetical protein